MKEGLYQSSAPAVPVSPGNPAEHYEASLVGWVRRRSTRALVEGDMPARVSAGFLGPDRFTAEVPSHVESARSGQKAQLVRGRACNFFSSPS